jgi:predicted Zn-dependent peptidase
MRRSTLAATICFIALSAGAQSKHPWKEAVSGGYTYTYVAGDPTQTRFYTLKNGLKAMLSVNQKEPRIRALIGVRAGSNQDPDNHTGLAHYLEHLLFKGTDKFGTTSWIKEAPYLRSIDSLYEVYNKITDPERRKAIYAEIDRKSGEAANYAIANEYDKMIAAMGGQASNAHTWVEETVYEEYIPSGSLDKYLTLQAERFRNPVFRIFHTELEAVYEEKNRSVDNDGSKVQEAMLQATFPTHHYGQHTTIGTVEHLKNPSLKEIRKFYDTYYVPNNMGIVLSGDFDPDSAIKKIDAAFSYMKPKPLAEYLPAPEKPLSSVTVKEVSGPTAESIYICYRSAAEKTREALLADLASSILSNGKAGLFDLNLIKQQKMLGAGASEWEFKDYGMMVISGSPKQGQTLEQVKNLLLEEIDNLKKGAFDESLIRAVANNQKLSQLTGNQSNISRANAIMNAFILNRGDRWDRNVSYLDDMATVTKKEIIDFANRYFRDSNYSIVYKRKGEDKTIRKVEKPVITPVAVNEKAQSTFAAMINAIPAGKIAPQWIDFTKEMQIVKKDGREILYTQNLQDQVFRQYYVFEMGTYNDKLLPYAAQYLQFLGTDTKKADEISKEFFNLACSFSIGTGTKTTSVALSGLYGNYEKAAALLEELITRCVPDEQALADMKARILKNRANAKTNRANILSGLATYAQYGPENPFNYDLSNPEIESLTSAQLIATLHQLLNYTHRVLYYGPQPLNTYATNLQKLHPAKSSYTAYPPRKNFKQLITDKKQVLFADYDMVQAEMRWIRNSSRYDPYNQAIVSVFNSYFGATLFQVIRESKALAYSTSGSYIMSGDKTLYNSISAYVGSQADKYNDVAAAMNELLNVLPESEKTFEAAKTNILNSIETQRISQEAILTEYMRLHRLGLNEDLRKITYEKLAPITFNDVKQFYQQNISGKPYTLVVLGSEKNLSITDMEKWGPVKTVSLEDIFGY